MKYKLIALDMDDTLMTSENKMSKRTKDALMKAQESGVKVVLASGRPVNGMLPTAKELHLDHNHSYILSYNGARTIDVSTETMMQETSLTKEQFDRVYDYCKNKGFFVLTYIDETIVYEGEHEYMNIEHELTGLPMMKVDNLKAYVQTNVPKAMGVDYEAKIAAANKELAGSFGNEIHATTSKPFFLEFMTEGVSKGRALHQLAQHLNIKQSEIMAFGDSNNDIDMLEYAGLGVAMGNGNDRVKAVADIITGDHNEDGIADIIEKYIINQK